MEQKAITLPNGDHVAGFTGGINLAVKTADGKGLIDFEADRMIIWTKDDLDQMMVKMRSSEGQSSNEYGRVYLAGNVEIRQKDGKNERNLKRHRKSITTLKAMSQSPWTAAWNCGPAGSPIL